MPCSHCAFLTHWCKMTLDIFNRYILPNKSMYREKSVIHIQFCWHFILYNKQMVHMRRFTRQQINTTELVLGRTGQQWYASRTRSLNFNFKTELVCLGHIHVSMDCRHLEKIFVSLKGHPDFKPLKRQAAQHKNSQITSSKQRFGTHLFFFSLVFCVCQFKTMWCVPGHRSLKLCGVSRDPAV